MSESMEKVRRMSADEAEEYLVTMERLRRFNETELGVSLADVEDWMRRRRLDPDVPCPLPAKLR